MEAATGLGDAPRGLVVPDREGRTRVLSVIESLGRGGAEQMLVSADRALDKQRFEHSVVSLFRADDLAEQFQAAGTTVHTFGLSGPEALPEATRRVAREVANFRPHVVHTHLFTANVAGRVAAWGKSRIVTTLHNPDYSRDQGSGPRFFVRSALDRTTGHLIKSRLLAVSEHVRDDYRSTMGFEGIEVLPNAVDVTGLRRRYEDLDRGRLRRAQGLGPESFAVVHVGRLHRQKAQDVLIRAFATLHSRMPHARLLLVGEGPDREALEAQARATGVEAAISFPGVVADVRPFLAVADVFAFPSRFEAFGIALLEAMAVGLPTVVSNIDGLNEITDSHTSLVVAEGDAAGLAESLQRVHDDPSLAGRMGAAGARRASQFDLKPTVRRLEEIYADEAKVGPVPHAPQRGATRLG